MRSKKSELPKKNHKKVSMLATTKDTLVTSVQFKINKGTAKYLKTIRSKK